MKYGTLIFQRASEAPELLASSVREYINDHMNLHDVWVSGIDPTLADTSAFCQKYEIGMDVSANCVIVEAKRRDQVWYAACVVLATIRADVNGIIRKALGARKVSFAAMDVATSLTKMEYGGITPIGLPAGWPIYIDSQVIKQEKLIIGSGNRKSKILTTPDVLRSLPDVQVMSIAKPLS